MQIASGDEGRSGGPAAITATSILCVVLGFLAIFIDGFDNYLISYAAPYITVDWGITDKTVLGPVFSATLVGAAIGAVACGYAADKVGARLVVVACCMLMALPSLLIPWAKSLDQLILLRLVVGLGVGGLQPVLLALTSEHVPAKHRATLVTAMWSGITFGVLAAGAAGTWFMPVIGWKSSFLIGGGASAVIGVLCLAFLPDSLSFQRGKGAEDSSRPRPPSIREAVKTTFAGRLAMITPLLWVLHGGLLIAFYAIGNWLPTLLSSLGMPPSRAGSFGMIFQVGGTFGAVAMSWLIDRGRLGVMAWVLGIALPLVALIGFVSHNIMLLYLTVFTAGLGIISVQTASNAVATLVYPAKARSSAMGLYFVNGRAVGAVGPMMISWGLVLGIPTQHALTIVCVPLVLSLAAAVMLIAYRSDIYGPAAPAK